jgi:hypothetical protein
VTAPLRGDDHGAAGEPGLPLTRKERFRRRFQRFATLSTVLGAVISLVSALGMRDSVRLVDILALFFGGMGTGAGLASLGVARARARSERTVA